MLKKLIFPLFLVSCTTEPVAAPKEECKQEVPVCDQTVCKEVMKDVKNEELDKCQVEVKRLKEEIGSKAASKAKKKADKAEKKDKAAK